MDESSGGSGAALVARYAAVRRERLGTKAALRAYVRETLGLTVADQAVCPDHDSPLDYLWHSVARDFRRRRPGPGDALVWANRGGGKTQLAALATLLDVVFKPGCQVRILGGSGQQSGRMFEYLAEFFARGFDECLAGPILKGRCRLRNGSGVEILTQSATSVRGTHVQKLRCDEVELFDPQVLAAAKFTTLSAPGAAGGLELISTLHRPYGLMQQEVEAAGRTGARVFRWCVWETIARCRRRRCRACPLADDCAGRARRSHGYLAAEDVIAQMRRSSRAAWEAEMLCLRPLRENLVFGEFERGVHVRPLEYDPRLPLYRALDFGFVNPFVCLWLQVAADGTVRVLQEYVRRGATIATHAAELHARTACRPEAVAATFCDPAGSGLDDITGSSAVRELRDLGIPTRYRPSAILEGIDRIRRALRRADGAVGLAVAPACVRLIEALESYHYPEAPGGELPLKDGVYDHPIDALRYFFAGLAGGGRTTTRRY
ncbi:MAG: hypothetical protein FJ280_07065 [Planctomycetes bacterium]|nr:hypothetical protein [Planctomycetota bacterium]